MFSKLKQFKDLRSQAKQMQNVLGKESISTEKNGVKVTMSGNMEITSLSLNEQLDKISQENATKSAINDAIKQTQRLMAKKMQEMGGFPGM